jgi:hypothetical protein
MESERREENMDDIFVVSILQRCKVSPAHERAQYFIPVRIRRIIPGK